MSIGDERAQRRRLDVVDCGLADYREILQQQLQLQQERRDGRIRDTVLIVEHSPVITLGARQSANKLLVSRKELAGRGIDVVEIRRGGGTTAHNPGQLVLYPILRLRELRLGIGDYIRRLETIGAELLSQLGVRATRREGFPGLWIGDRKIASIGVRVSKGVTCHGMAINIRNELSIFDHLIPCGLDGVEITSVLKETGQHYPMADVKEKIGVLLSRHLCAAPASRSTGADTGVPAAANESQATSHSRRKLPPWLRRPLRASPKYREVEKTLSSLQLHTICGSANCPNRGQCWSRGTATVLILGEVCTRNCKFCSVPVGRPAPPDPAEPARLAEMALKMRLEYLVITSVNRDDLPDGGASHFRDCIDQVRQKCPDMKFEILTPDFRNCQEQALQILSEALPFVFAHNIETVPRLYRAARAGADYERSLNLLKMAQTTGAGTVTKSSIMLGLGETEVEVEQVLRQLREVGCDRITIGQYLKPSKDSLEVVEYIPPAKFDFWRHRASDLGFSWVVSAPFARSSYFAEQDNIQAHLAGDPGLAESRHNGIT
ncbi:MAG: lipoyl synthase [Phycisphaerales bacterium]|nr:MAG: lipoyl synthase [Phycisphaerales bacterium]